jgi:(p)ppGpp synthase/HD superfamily hydrolase
MLYAAAIDRALIIAAHVHETQTRKGSHVPYIIHPVHVARLLERSGADESLVIAGLLHDVLEDIAPDDRRAREGLIRALPHLRRFPGAPADVVRELPAALREQFGDRVLALVQAVTETKKDAAGNERPWADRKRESLKRFERDAQHDPDVARLKAADVLHNARSIVEDIRTGIAAADRRFKATPRETLWYYASVAAVVRRVLPDWPLTPELDGAVAELERLIAEREERMIDP